MKKLVVLGMILVFSLGVIACGKEEKTDSMGQETTNQSNTEDNVTDTSNESMEEVEQNSEETEVELENVFRGHKGRFYIDIPAWQEVEGAATHYFKFGNEKLIAITCDWDSSTTSVKDAYGICFDWCKIALQNYVHPNNINITSEEEMTVNGWEVYRFEGLMNCGWEEETATEEFVVGYSFIAAEEMPCMVIGLVRDESQSQELCDEMEAIIDAMINTLRTEK